jgi:protein-tyrosine-phosphatase
MRDFESPSGRDLDVPDPYYSGEKAFENIFDLLGNCCRGLLSELTK